MERLAIVTICFNDREGLARTIASVLGQTSKAFEYIVIDGGSTDGSVDLIQANASRITEWVSEKDDGIFDAQNKGWRIASAPHVLFLNAGDALAAPDVVERALAEVRPDTDIAYADLNLSDQRGIHRIKRYPARITSAWLMKETVAHPTQFIRKALLEKYLGYDVAWRIVADYAFFARAFWQGHITLQKLDFVVSTFDTGGLSSSPARRADLARERKAVQKLYAPAFWYRVYHSYAALNRLIGR